MKSFEARINALKHKMEAGLSERAAELRGAAERLLSGDDEARREIKRLSHKLRGIAGTYGHMDLTELAANVEQRASISPPPVVAALARELADEAIRISTDSAPAVEVLSEPPPPRLEPKRSASEPGKAPLRVLGMDDDPNTLKLLKLTLQQVGGFDAVVVESATDALEELKEREFDLVVSDAMMPDMNGLEFCEAARELGGRAAQTPIVILSAATPDELGWSHKTDLSTGWLRKPFKPVWLVEQIEEIIAKDRAGR